MLPQLKDQAQKIVGGGIQQCFRVLGLPFELLQKIIGQARMPYAFLVPNLAFFGIFVIIPLFINYHYSLSGGTDLYLEERTYIGTEHYETLLACDDYLDPKTCKEDYFWRAVYNSMVFVFFQVIFMVLFSLITALILNKEIRARGFFRAVYFFPVLLSPVVVALTWKWILLRYGVFNAGLEAVGIKPVSFLVERNWAMFWSIFISIWAHMGFYTLILLAGLQAIPKDLYEAAQMDRTSKERILFRITLPLLWPNMLVVLVLVLIKAVQIFDEVFVLTGGGPGTATTFFVQYIYVTGFAQQINNYGLAAAASVLLGIILLVLTLCQLSLSKRSS